MQRHTTHSYFPNPLFFWLFNDFYGKRLGLVIPTLVWLSLLKSRSRLSIELREHQTSNVERRIRGSALRSHNISEL